MDLNVHEAGTGAVRSIEVANERWDLMSGYALKRIKNVSSLEPYRNTPLELFDWAIDICHEFLGGQRSGNPLEHAAFNVMVGISILDHPSCYRELQARLDQDEHMSKFRHLPYWGLVRLATTCDEGATKYAEENWLHGFQVKSLLNHAIRHLRKWICGDDTEDHLGHSLWNIVAAVHMFNLRPDMRDLLLGPNWTITDEIQRYHDQHASRRRLSKAERSRHGMAARLAGEGLATSPGPDTDGSGVVQPNGQASQAPTVANLVAGGADPFKTLPHGPTVIDTGHEFRDGWSNKP
jgi:hypothetical protein